MRKYSEFFFAGDGIVHFDKEYWVESKKDELSALKKFTGKIYCPMCKKAPLCIVNGYKLKYFKVTSLNMHKHDKNCIYRLDEANKEETKLFYSELDLDKDDFQNKLISCMNVMLKQMAGNSSDSEKANISWTQEGENAFVINTLKRGKKYLPHCNLYSIKSIEDFEDDNLYKIYYGKCKIYMTYYKDETTDFVKRYYLKILNDNNLNLICTLSMSDKVYKHLNISFSEEKQNAKSYLLCFSAKMKKMKRKYGYFLECSLEHSKMAIFKEIK